MGHRRYLVHHHQILKPWFSFLFSSLLLSLTSLKSSLQLVRLLKKDKDLLYKLVMPSFSSVLQLVSGFCVKEHANEALAYMPRSSCNRPQDHW